MATINKTYSGIKTGKNFRIDWDAETVCLPGTPILMKVLLIQLKNDNSNGNLFPLSFSF